MTPISVACRNLLFGLAILLTVGRADAQPTSVNAGLPLNTYGYIQEAAYAMFGRDLVGFNEMPNATLNTVSGTSVIGSI